LTREAQRAYREVLGKSLMPDSERAPLVRRAFEEYATRRFTKEQLLSK
jgi:hypothetical protein